MDVQLVGLQEEHLEMVRIWRNSNEVSKYMYSSPQISSEQQIAWFNKLNHDTDKYWVISFGDRQLGLASINDIDVQNSKASWAFYLGDTTIRGEGIGTKVEFKMLQQAFDVLGLNKLSCEVFNSNDLVVRMHERFGFRREGYFRQHILKNDEFHDVVVLAMTRNEWLSIREFHEKRIYGRNG